MGPRFRRDDIVIKFDEANSALSPPQPPHDGAAHHPVLVLLGQERQLLGEVSDALLVGEVGETVDAGGEVGAPEAAARAEGVERA